MTSPAIRGPWVRRLVAAYCFSGFFAKTSFATVTAVTALGQPA
jgi:hypothetical protein